MDDDLGMIPVSRKPPTRLLELGSGDGMVSALFAQRGHGVAGLDLSAVAVNWANELFQAASMPGSFRPGDVCDMPFYSCVGNPLVAIRILLLVLSGKRHTRIG